MNKNKIFFCFSCNKETDNFKTYANKRSKFCDDCNKRFTKKERNSNERKFILSVLSGLKI